MLIGFTGRAQVGKDTAAAHLRAAHGFRQIAFADPLRAMLQTGFGLTAKDFEPGRKEELLPLIGKSPRQLMQSMGTEWGRTLVSPDVWVTLAEGASAPSSSQATALSCQTSAWRTRPT